MKTCSKCHLSKDESDFGKNASRPDGLQYECRACRVRPKKEKPPKAPPGDMKSCSKCKVIKPLEAFHKCASRPDGLQPWCKLCLRTKQRAYEKRYGDSHERKPADPVVSSEQVHSPQSIHGRVLR